MFSCTCFQICSQHSNRGDVCGGVPQGLHAVDPRLKASPEAFSSWKLYRGSPHRKSTGKHGLKQLSPSTASSSCPQHSKQELNIGAKKQQQKGRRGSLNGKSDHPAGFCLRLAGRLGNGSHTHSNTTGYPHRHTHTHTLTQATASPNGPFV